MPAITTHFNRWCSSLEVHSFEALCDLIALEQFKNSVPSRIATYINEHKVKTALEAAKLADEYALVHCESTEPEVTIKEISVSPSLQINERRKQQSLTLVSILTTGLFRTLMKKYVATINTEDITRQSVLTDLGQRLGHLDMQNLLWLLHLLKHQ